MIFGRCVITKIQLRMGLEIEIHIGKLAVQLSQKKSANDFPV